MSADDVKRCETDISQNHLNI